MFVCRALCGNAVLTMKKNALSPCEQHLLTSELSNWSGRAQLFERCAREEVNDAIRSIYRAARRDSEIAIFWCDGPRQLLVMPFVVDALIRYKTANELSAHLTSPMRKELETQRWSIWSALWKSAHRQLESFLAADDTAFISARKIGAQVGDELHRRINPLGSTLKEALLERIEDSLCRRIESEIAQTVDVPWQESVKKVEKVLLKDAQSIVSRDLWGQLDYSMRTLLAAELSEMFGRKADPMKALNYPSAERYNLSQLLSTRCDCVTRTALRRDLLLFHIAEKIWPEPEWSAGLLQEARAWISLSNAFGFAFFENACFICEQPTRVSTTNGDSSILWSDGFSVPLGSPLKDVGTPTPAKENKPMPGQKRSAPPASVPPAKNDGINVPAPRGNTNSDGAKCGGKAETPKPAQQKKPPVKLSFSVDDPVNPSQIKDALDQYVIDQDEAKRILAVAFSNHLKRVRLLRDKPKSEVQKSNVLLVGPTGSGKTFLVETLAKMCDLPIVIADATSLTQTGYAGEDVTNLLFRLRKAANGDIAKAERGIIYIDEIDKLRKHPSSGLDVAGQGVQECLLRMLDGSSLTVSDRYGKENLTINTRNVMVICSGAFVGLHKGHAEHRMGTLAAQDLIDYGMIPEFIGRFSLLGSLDALDSAALKRILVEPRNALVKQYKTLLAHDNATIEFDEDALDRIVKKALSMNTGARALKSVVDTVMKDIMFNALSGKHIAVTKEMVDAAAKTDSPESKRVTMDDVAGNEEAKADLMDVVRYLRNPDLWQKLKIDLPKGILLMGEPGNGKTLLARAVAGEAGVEFLSASGSDFVELWVGQGAQRVRELFSKAADRAPCVVFIDEIDALAKKRNSVSSDGGREYDQTVNAFLVELDGFARRDGVVVIGATNRLEDLDPAVIRPGRFDRKINVELPDREARKMIFALNLKDRNLEDGLKSDDLIEHLADRTAGASGAFCAAVIQEAALLSGRRLADQADKLLKHGLDIDCIAAQLAVGVRMSDFDEAIDKVRFGALNAGRNRMMTEADKLNTAVHEVGHALTATLLDNNQYRVTKVTIIARSHHLGFAAYTPKDAQVVSSSKQELETQMKVALGGRAACELLLGSVDTGPSSDFEKVWNIACRYVTVFGMSELGIAPLHTSTYQASSEFAAEIDRTIRALVQRMKDETYQLLGEHKELIMALAHKLVERETILAPEWESIIAEHLAR